MRLTIETPDGPYDLDADWVIAADGVRSTVRGCLGLVDPDVAYRTIVEAHRNLAEAESASLNATLVLLLANHIGDLEVIAAAVKLAHQHVETKRGR